MHDSFFFLRKIYVLVLFHTSGYHIVSCMQCTTVEENEDEISSGKREEPISLESSLSGWAIMYVWVLQRAARASEHLTSRIKNFLLQQLLWNWIASSTQKPVPCLFSCYIRLGRIPTKNKS